MTQHQLKPKSFVSSFYSAARSRLAPQVGILEERWLHKIFLWSHIPATWSPLKLAGGLVLAALAVWLAWLPFGGSLALIPAAVYLGFALADWLMLWWLPASGRSFGPVGPQLFVKTAPRLGAALLAAVLAWLTGSFTAGLWLLLPLQLLGAFVYLWGTFYEPFALATTNYPLQARAWPAHSSPLRLLHLSDLHIERLTRRESRLLELIEQAEPDLIVITGDYLNLSYVNDPTARSEVRKLLAKLDAPYGVYATLGSPPVDPRDTTPALFEGLKIRLLRDEVAVLQLADQQTLSLIGLDCEHDLDSDASVLRELLQLTPPDSTRVLLYHSPELMPLAQEHPIDLYLCGHTHGGQIRMPWYGAILTSSVTGKRYEMGPYTERDTTLYVSRGIGLEGLSAPRMRLLCRPEIILFTLSGNGTSPKVW